MAASDATPFPLKNTAYRVYFPILDADGDLVTGAADLDSERSLDGATFADCTNEATEIATGSGMYFLDLTAAEMDTNCTVVIVKTSSAGAKTTPIALYPVGDDQIPVNVKKWDSVNVATPTVGGVPEVDLTHVVGTILTEGAAGRLAAAFIKLFDVTTPTLVASDVMRGTDSVVLSGPTKAEMDTAHALLATPAQVNTEVDDVLRVDTQTLPGQVAPPLTPSIVGMLTHLYKPWRNPSEQDSSQQRLFDDAGTTVDQKRTVNETTGGVVELGKVLAGPA